MSHLEERQPGPNIEADQRVETNLQGPLLKIKRFWGPIALVFLCWALHISGAIVQARTPRWDSVAMFVTVFSFSALVFGFLILPFVVLSLTIEWWKAPIDQKGAASSNFFSWAFAWFLLVVGHQVVPWSEAFP